MGPSVEWVSGPPKGRAITLVAGTPVNWCGSDFVDVPRGPFVMGSAVDDDHVDNDEKPQHVLDIPYDFWVGTTPVTNDHFESFVRTTSYRTNAERKGRAWVWNGKEQRWEERKGADWRHPLGPESDLDGLEHHPVVSVSFHDARAYCDWLTTNAPPGLPKGYRFRLPSEAEWEKAARGPDGNLWPWGNHFDMGLCNCGEDGPGVVVTAGAHSPLGDSYYGVSDMSGNIWEWTTTLWGTERYVRTFVYPYQLDDGRDNEHADDSFYRIVRGGSFKDDRWTLRSACRDVDLPRFSLNNLGMRVVAAP